ncbi:MAG: YadA-like family protein, partial [Veillonella sp.]|nr:YadA-like family protein [Veillonella sp.]
MNKKFLLVAGVLTIVSGNVMGAVTTDVVRGKNIYVTKTTDSSGNNEFKVGLNNNLYDLGTATFHSDESGAFTGGNSYITGDRMSISNLGNEDTVYVTPTRVTISKLESGLPKESTTISSSEFHIQKFDDNWHHHRTIVDHTGLRSTNNDTGKSVQFSTVIISAGEQQIHDVAKGIDDTDAVNVKQLKDYVAANGTVDTNTITTVTNGDNATVTGTTDASGNKDFKVAVNKDLTDMNSATFGNGDERNVVDKTGVRTFNGSVNTGITANGMVIENTDTLEQASYTGSSMQASDDNATIRFSTIGIDAGNQIINGVKSGVADTDAVNVKQLKEYMSTNDKDTITTVKAGNNIEVTANGHDYTVSLNKDVVDKIDNATAGVKANADAIKSNTDAIKANTADIADNKAQIDNLVNQIGNNDTKINNMISNTRHEARRGIASASALAALHPLDYNPDHKVDVMGGVGHYRGKTAVALGAAYRPNESLMFTVGTAING